MAIQLTDAISTGNSCMLSSYPSIGLPNTYQPLTVMAWLNNNSWTTTIRSIIGMYDGTTSYKFGNGLEPSFVNGYTDNDTRMVL